MEAVMKISKNDLCVFVATCNRPDLVLVQLKSLLAQTVRPDSITVLDNGGLPETKVALEPLAPLGVRLVDTSALGRLGNLKMAQKLAEGRYVAVFHDDDAVECHYFETILAVLNSGMHDDIRLVLANSRHQKIGRFSYPSAPAHACGWVLDMPQMADYLLAMPAGYFPFAFYSIEAFKAFDIDRIWGLYEKWCDIPILLEAIAGGNAIVLQYPFGVYGRHPNQDSGDRQNLPDVRAWANLEAVYVNALGEDLHTATGWTNVIWNRRRLTTGYKRRGKKTIGWKEYLQYAADIGAVNSHPLLSWLLSRRVIQKAYSKMRCSRYMGSVKELGGCHAK